MIDVAKHLQVGQTVHLETTASGYQITPLPPEQPGMAVVAVGPDYVVLDDELAGVKTRIPGHCLKLAAARVASLPQAA